MAEFRYANSDHRTGSGHRHHILKPRRKTMVLCQNEKTRGLWRIGGDAGPVDLDRPSPRVCKNCLDLARRALPNPKERDDG